MPDEYQDENRYKGSFRYGLVVTLGLHLLQIPMNIIFGLTPFFMGPLIFIGVSQLIYMIPAIIYFKRQGESETVKGLITGASVTLLLNAACTGIFWNMQFAG